MKTQIPLFCVLLLLAGSLTVQEADAKKRSKQTVKTEQSESTSDQLGTLVGASMPTFQGGGLEEFRQWIMAHLQFPQNLPPEFTQATVMVGFVV